MIRIGSVIALVGLVVIILSVVFNVQRGADPAHEGLGQWLSTSLGVAILVVGVVLTGFGLFLQRRRLPSGH